jgi:hypothetical protein
VVPAWEEVLAAENAPFARLGLPGTTLDLTGLPAPPEKP